MLAHFPHLRAPDLSGAVVFEDGQMYNPARLVLAFVKGAVAAGATACNYIEAQRFVWDGVAVRGVRVRDHLSGDTFDVRARLTLNAAGPWADYLLHDPEHFGACARGPFSRDAYFIVDRPPTSEYGVAVQGLSRDKDALLGRSTRHLFAAPWRDKTLFGVWHRHFQEPPDAACVEREEIDRWIDELNSVYPELRLAHSEVTFANCGLVPFGETATETELSFGKESRIVDHRAAERRQRTREFGGHSLHDRPRRCAACAGSASHAIPHTSGAGCGHGSSAVAWRRHRRLPCVSARRATRRTCDRYACTHFTAA